MTASLWRRVAIAKLPLFIQLPKIDNGKSPKSVLNHLATSRSDCSSQWQSTWFSFGRRTARSFIRKPEKCCGIIWIRLISRQTIREEVKRFLSDSSKTAATGLAWSKAKKIIHRCHRTSVDARAATKCQGGNEFGYQDSAQRENLIF